MALINSSGFKPWAMRQKKMENFKTMGLKLSQELSKKLVKPDSNENTFCILMKKITTSFLPRNDGKGANDRNLKKIVMHGGTAFPKNYCKCFSK